MVLRCRSRSARADQACQLWVKSRPITFRLLNYFGICPLHQKLGSIIYWKFNIFVMFIFERFNFYTLLLMLLFAAFLNIDFGLCRCSYLIFCFVWCCFGNLVNIVGTLKVQYFMAIMDNIILAIRTAFIIYSYTLSVTLY